MAKETLKLVAAGDLADALKKAGTWRRSRIPKLPT
jgi:hypothetical protein